MPADLRTINLESNASGHTRMDRLRAAAQALNLTVSEHECKSLLRYVDLLGRWNRAYNLTAIRDPDAMLIQHVFDTLAIIEPLAHLFDRIGRQPEAATPPTIWDWGSGAGVPGLLLAVLWPRAQIDTFDSVAKKIAFQNQVIAELSLPNAHAHHQRIEALRPSVPPDLIVARAFTSLAEFAKLAEPCAGPATWLAAMKGQAADAEVNAIPATWRIHERHTLRVPELDARRELFLLCKAPN